MTATAFVTGAGGFIGSAIVRRLVDEGLEVRALVRGSRLRRDFASRSVHVFDGDILDGATVAAAMAGSRYVFHVAARYVLARNHRTITYETNIRGTEIVMREALRAGVERVVYTSSVATVAMRPDGSPADELAVLSEHDAIGAYKRSKVAAERFVRAMAGQGLPVVIVNPATTIGPQDVRPTPSGRIVLAAASGRIPAFVETGLNLVHVDDVAAGHVAALRRGRIGERYILGGQNVPFSQMLADIAILVGRRPPHLRLPWYAALPAALVGEALAGITGREPLATFDGVRQAKERMYFTSAKAERELDYAPRPYVEALRDAVTWFADHGYVKRPRSMRFRYAGFPDPGS